MEKEYKLVKIPEKEIIGPSAWYGNILKEKKDWIIKLSKVEIQEIKNAILDTK